MVVELFTDALKLGFIVFCLFAVIRAYAHRRQPSWSILLEQRRLGVVSVLVLVALTIKVTEDVVGGESGPIDRAILLFIQANGSAALTAFFAAITLSGSAKVLTPVVSLITLALWYRKHREEAFLLAASALSGVGLVYVVKKAVGRARPDLWPTAWYSGSSFPSGHTLGVAAIATAGALIAIQLSPPSRRWVVSVAFLWTLLVALSRLVLGVHWPTDVLAAACIGATLPLLISLGLAVKRR